MKLKYENETRIIKDSCGKFVCQICNLSVNGLGSHITQKHRIKTKDYYDKYIRIENEGICPMCGKETSFRGIMKGGYLSHCSVKCLQNNPETIQKKKETSRRLHGVDNWRNPDKARKTLAKHLEDGTVVKQEYIQSAAENEIIDFIKPFYDKPIIHGDRTVLDGYELDVWLPDIKVGIEYDGMFWHADPDRFKPDDIVIKGLTAKDIWQKDKRKDLLAESKGINLYRIKEKDYIENKSICLSNLYKYIKQFMEI